MKSVKIIGITGGSASGKSLLANKLYESFIVNDRVVIIKQDDYYKSQDHLTMEQRLETNYDHPLAFDNDLLISHIEQLKNDETIQKPIYDFVNHTRSKIFEKIGKVDVIILEGLFVLENEKIRDLCDIKVYVDTDADIRFIRKIKRDINERGRDIDFVIHQYLTTVKPMHNRFISPSRYYADVIIPEGGENKVALQLLFNTITKLLEEGDKYGN